MIEMFNIQKNSTGSLISNIHIYNRISDKNFIKCIENIAAFQYEIWNTATLKYSIWDIATGDSKKAFENGYKNQRISHHKT